MILVTGLFLLFTGKVFADENLAGTSASLAYVNQSLQESNQSIDDYKKRMAIMAIFKKYNSPMVGEADSFLAACKKYQIDCYLLPSIAGLESTFGQFIYPDSYNPFGWGGGYIKFNDWSSAIDTVASGIKENYIDKGAKTVWEIGPIYSTSPTWASRVNWFESQFKSEEDKIPLFSSVNPVQL